MTMLSENRAAPRRQHDHGTSGARLAKNVHLTPRDVWTTRVRLQLEGQVAS